MSLVSSFGYESFFGLLERPFSLTPDPKYYFRSRSHGRAFHLVAFAIKRREPFLLVTGDLGVGKSTLCRVLAEQLARRLPISLVANPLVSPEDLLRLLLEDLGAVTREDAQRGKLAGASRPDMHQQLCQHLLRADAPPEGAAVVIDEAQRLPAAVVAELLAMESLERDGRKPLSLVLVGQSPTGDRSNLTIRQLDQRVSTRVRLLPFEPEECGDYIAHRLRVASTVVEVTFSPRAVATVYKLSGGVPRLVNLICERALQECALVGARRVEPPMVESAAAQLELLRARPRRFRWFGNRVS